MKTLTESVTYKIHSGETKVKVFKVNNYQTAYDCLLYIESQSAKVKFIKKLVDGLSADEIKKLKSLFTPSKTETKARIKASNIRKAVMESPKFNRHVDRLTAQMIAHPGFMSNSPF